jgi:hypothetical protein
MRMMLKFTLPVETSNAAINDGSLGRTMESILSKLKPEAAYFTPLEGKRGGMIFLIWPTPRRSSSPSSRSSLVLMPQPNSCRS